MVIASIQKGRLFNVQPPLSKTAPESSKRVSVAFKQQTHSTSRKARRMLIQFILLSCVMVIVICGVAALIDPLQFYRKATWYEPKFSQEQRYQNPGLAKNYEYDTIIIGTSMTENFIPSEVDAAFGGRTMKLSIRGSTVDEQYEIARLALETGKVRKVLWGVDYFSLKLDTKTGNYDFPEYLYDDNVFNDIQYLFNYSVYEQWYEGVLRQLYGNGSQDINYLYNWNNKVEFGEEYVLADYKKAQQKEYYFGLNEEPVQAVQQAFNTYILALVKEHPEVEFNFYYPPYSILRQKVWQDTNSERYSNQLEMKQWMFEQLNEWPNTAVYDFQEELEWTYNLNLYKDLSHHHQDINSWIAQAIGRKDTAYRMTTENRGQFRADLEEQLQLLVVSQDGHVMNVRTTQRDSSTGIQQELSFSDRIVSVEHQEILVPVKQALGLLESTMNWDQATKTLTLRRGEERVQMVLGQKEAHSTSRGTVMLEMAPELLKTSTMIPLRTAAELLGIGVRVKRADARSLDFIVEKPREGES